MRIVYGIGRAIFGGFFLYNGINHLQNRKALEGYAAMKQAPAPEISVSGSGALMAAAGTALMLGIKPAVSGTALATFVAIASVIMHDFWNQTDPQLRQAEMIQFTKNIGLIGAALAIAGEAGD